MREQVQEEMSQKFYRILKRKYPCREDVLTEIVNLEAILELPKGTEHFMSDLHGEYEAFNHVMRNGSGSIRQKLAHCFPDMAPDVLQDLAVLIYYPTDKLQLERRRRNAQDLNEWYRCRIWYLTQAVRFAGKKYTRKKVRKTFPAEFRYIIDELLTEASADDDKKDYYDTIVTTLIVLGQAPAVIRALAIVVQDLTVDHLHIVGDIYDRGPYPDKIVDRLMAVRSLDIQWGNHDVAWMAILAGSKISMMNVIRMSARYGSLTIIEDRYGVNLRPFIAYSKKYYTPKAAFAPKLLAGQQLDETERDVLNVVQQAAFMLQLKLEEALIGRRPDFEMDERRLLSRTDPKRRVVRIGGREYPLVDFDAPTVNFIDPSELLPEEVELLDHILDGFQSSEKFVRHMRFLLDSGSMYLRYNDNLLVHGCVPVDADGDMQLFTLGEQSYKGRALFDFFDRTVREAMLSPQLGEDLATDLMWYLWCGPKSVLFGKSAMTTFERYFIEDKSTHTEVKNPYYRFRKDELFCTQLLEHFGLPADGHIINGHTPVKERDGEEPVLAGGKLIVIDGGFSKAYQPKTGIAGYTLLYNSYGIQIVSHEPFTSIEDVVERQADIVGTRRLVEEVPRRKKISDTNIGTKLRREVFDLLVLYDHYDQY